LLGSLQVSFDKPLNPGILDPGNWRLRYSETLYSTISAAASGSAVNCNCIMGVEDIGPNVFWYDAWPPDLLGLDLQQVAPIVAFPIE